MYVFSLDILVVVSQSLGVEPSAHAAKAESTLLVSSKSHFTLSVFPPPAPLIQTQVWNKESCFSENTYQGSAWSVDKKSQKQIIVNTFLGILLKSRAKVYVIV